MENMCTLCDKTFANNKGFMKHKRNIHGIFCIDKDRRKDEEKDCYLCKYCKKEYVKVKSRWVHEKKCKIENEKENDRLLVLKEENDKLKNELLQNEMKHQQQIIKLQQKIISSNRLDNKTFKAVNKILMDNSYNNSNNTVNNINNITYQMLAIGNEDLVNVLTMEQKKHIMDSRLGSLEKLVEIAHCGEYNQFKNIIITNLKDNYAYQYDQEKGYFVSFTKDVLLDKLINDRVMDIEDIYDELKNANKIGDRTKRLIQDFLDKMNNEKEPFFDNEVKYDNFKLFKMSKIKILLYNNHDKITKDIALFISNPKEIENTLHELV